MWFPQEQTAQLVLRGSQPYVRMTFFHNKTATTESNSKEVLFQIEKFKVPAGFKQNLGPFSPNGPKVCFRPSLILGPPRSAAAAGGVNCGETVAHSKEGEGMRGPGSVHSTWVPSVRKKVAFPGMLSRDVDSAEWRMCGLPCGSQHLPTGSSRSH